MNRRTFVQQLGLGTLGLSLKQPAAYPATPTESRADREIPSYLAAYRDLYQKDPRAAALRWFREARFGLFVHYALVSLLPQGRDEWSQLEATMKGQDFSLSREMFARFTAARFDAAAIADLAVSAGMRYVNFTTQHRGNLAMWRTQTTDFNSLHTPARRDLVDEMARACRDRGLGLFLYVPALRSRTDEAVRAENQKVLRELLTQYGPIAGIWFDSLNAYHAHPEQYTRLSETYALIRSLQPQCLISFKEAATGEEDFLAPEHQKRVPAAGSQRAALWEKVLQYKPTEICTTLNARVEQRLEGAPYKPVKWFDDIRARHQSPEEVWKLLQDCRRQDANLLLDVGLLGDGAVHPRDVQTLTAVGVRIRQHGLPE